MLQFGIIPTSEFLHLTTNHDRIKAVIHTDNMKFRKLKKYNVRNTNKTWQLKQDSHNKCSNCPRWAFTQSCRIGIENNKNLVEIKPVLVVKHVEILPFIFNFRQSRTHIRQCGHWAVNISYCRKFIKVSLCQKLQKLVDIWLSYCKNKKVQFFETAYIVSMYRGRAGTVTTLCVCVHLRAR